MAEGEVFVALILAGLDPVLKPYKAHILTEEELPTVKNTFGRLNCSFYDRVLWCRVTTHLPWLLVLVAMVAVVVVVEMVVMVVVVIHYGDIVIMA